MSIKNLSVVGDASVVTQPADTASSANSVPLRDASGDLAAGNVVTAATTMVTSAGTRLKSTAKSANFTASKTESTFYVVDTSGGSVTVTLPSAATSADVMFGVKKTSGSNSLIVDGAAAELIDGAATLTATAIQAALLFWCDGTAWYTVSRQGTWS